MIPSPKILRAAVRARERADRAALVAERLEREAGIDRRALAIARTTSGGDPAHLAILAASLTVQAAAEICGTEGPILAKAWAKGGQFRPARPEWRRRLARYGVPRTVWRDEP